MTTKTLRDFDHEDYLNENGDAVIRTAPSTWRRYNISPDTYGLFTMDSYLDSEYEHLSEVGFAQAGYPELARYDAVLDHLHYDWFTHDWNHSGLVRDISIRLSWWLASALEEKLDSGVGVHVIDTWSPSFYNFESDGFEVEVLVDPKALRDATPDFDVDKWVKDHYSSVDGFISFVPHRMVDDDWVAEYDGGFRLEYLLDELDPYGDHEWIEFVYEGLHEDYMDNHSMEPNVEEIRERFIEVCGYEGSSFSLEELQEWASEMMSVYQAGMGPLFEVSESR